MQTIVHKAKYKHPFFTDIEHLYTITSEKEQAKTLVPKTLNEQFRPIVELFNLYGGTDYKFTYVSTAYDAVKTKANKKSVLVCFSGGKDSIATVLQLRKQGYKVTLFHIKNINATYRDEYKNVERVAELLKLPLVIDEINLRGKTCWTEHPMKNMIICELAMQYLLANNMPCRIAFGNFNTSTLNDDPFEICGGDCKEMWDGFNSIAHKISSSYELLIPLSNFQDTIEVFTEHPDLLPLAQSCIGSYRYREYTRKSNQIKYDIKIPEHKCGSCWKCCLEYCIFCDKGIYAYNEEFYKHCLRVLRLNLKIEQGRNHTRDEVWNHYFNYPRSQSMYKGKCWANKAPSTFRKVVV